MKTRFPFACVLALALSAMPFAGGCAQTVAQSSAATTPTTSVATDTSTSASITASAIEKPEPVKPVVEEAPPANLKITPALAEILRMVKSGVGKEVLIAFVNDSANRFALGAEEIIYLNDLGVADEVTAAMIERDRELRGDVLTASSAAPMTASAPTPATSTAIYAPQYQTPAVAPATELAPVQSIATPDSDASYFYDTLAPYGSWVNVSGYGLCWQPTVVVSTPGWRPYLDRGRWVSSDTGWYWLSDYSWGWAPFHYGRWFYHANHGWVWNPGRVWGPAWVSWRNSDEYCGWAPLPPEAGFVSGIGLTWHGRGVSTDFEFGLGWSSYSFVPVASFCDYNPHRYVAHYSHGRELCEQTRVVNKIRVKGDNNVVTVGGNGQARVRVKGDNNTVVFEGGADPRHVEAVTHVPVRRVQVKDSEGDPIKIRKADHIERENSEFVIYKPELPGRVSDRTRTAVAKVAATPERFDANTRNNNSRVNRESPNVRAADLRNNLTDTKPRTVVAVPPPAQALSVPAPRNDSTSRTREDVRGLVRGTERSQPRTVESPRIGETGGERGSIARTPDIARTSDPRTIRANNPAPARETITPATPDRSTTPSRSPVPRVENPRQNTQPSTPVVRQGDSRQYRSPSGAQNPVAIAPPVTTPAPTVQLPQRDRSQPIRVWNSPTPEPQQPFGSRSYTPQPAPAPSYNPAQPDRNPGRNDARMETPRYGTLPNRTPTYSAPTPAPTPVYSAPDRPSRNDSGSADTSRSNDNNRGGNDRGNNGGNGGGGNGGGNNRNDDSGSRSSGRNR